MHGRRASGGKPAVRHECTQTCPIFSRRHTRSQTSCTSPRGARPAHVRRRAASSQSPCVHGPLSTAMIRYSHQRLSHQGGPLPRPEDDRQARFPLEFSRARDRLSSSNAPLRAPAPLSQAWQSQRAAAGSSTTAAGRFFSCSTPPAALRWAIGCAPRDVRARGLSWEARPRLSAAQLRNSMGRPVARGRALPLSAGAPAKPSEAG